MAPRAGKKGGREPPKAERAGPRDGRGRGTPRNRGGGRGGPAARGSGIALHPPGIQQVPAHRARHHHALPIYNIDPDLGTLTPPQAPQLPCRQAPQHGDPLLNPAPAVRAPRAEPAQLAAALAAWGPSAALAPMAATPAAQEPRAGPARGAVGAPRPAEARSNWVWDSDAVTNTLLLEGYRWLDWAPLGYKRKRPFDATLLQRDGGNQDVAPGGW